MYASLVQICIFFQAWISQPRKLCLSVMITVKIPMLKYTDVLSYIHLSLHHLRVFNELTMWLALSWLVSSVEPCTGIAEVMDWNPVQAWIVWTLNNFTVAQVLYIIAIINYGFISFSAVHTYDLSDIHL